MFNPSRDQVRQFFVEAWQKHLGQHILTPLETMAVQLMEQHPEYHQDLSDPDVLQQDYSVQQGKSNPFLHLSMHLAIDEQLSIDQPPGIKAAHQQLLLSFSPHDASHIIMEALGEVLWESQRLGTPLNNERYIELILRHSTRDR